MRLIAFLDDGVPTMGELVAGAIAPILPVDRFYADLPTSLERARRAAPARGAPLVSEVQLAPLVPASAKIVCVGLNYRSHAEETGQEPPVTPAIFARWAATLNVHGGSIPVPAGEEGLDWEAELAVVIGASTSSIGDADLEEAILGYTAFNDVTARSLQFASSQWTLGKNVPVSAPMGPVIITRDEIADPQDLQISTRVNGALMQSARTSDMIFSVEYLIAYLRESLDLQPGDVIATGTPAGIGHVRDPRVLMQPGDEVDVEIQHIGRLSNTIAGVGLGVDAGAVPRVSGAVS